MGGFAAPPLTRLAGLAPGLAGLRPRTRGARYGACFSLEWACMLPCGAPGHKAPPRPVAPRSSGLSRCARGARPLSCPGRALCRPPSGCVRAAAAVPAPLRRATSRPACCLAYRARRSPVARGAVAPRRPRCARPLRLPGGSVPGSVVGFGLLAAPAPGCCASLRWSPLRLCGSAPAPPAARLGGSPQPRLFPSLLPPGGAAAAGRLFAALVRLRRRRAPGALGVPLRRERLRW